MPSPLLQAIACKKRIRINMDLKENTGLKTSTVWVGFLAVVLGQTMFAQAQDSLSPSTVSNGTNSIHIFPTVTGPNRLAGDPGPLLYHSGGVVMTSTRIYVIYWLPATLQDGSATSLPAHYQTVQTNMLKDYGGHSIATINTQYFQTIGTKTTYIANNVAVAATVVDTGAYPASGC